MLLFFLNSICSFDLNPYFGLFLIVYDLDVGYFGFGGLMGGEF